MERVLRICVLVVWSAVAPMGLAHGDSPLTLQRLNSHVFPEAMTTDGSNIAWIGNDRGRRNVWLAAAPNYQARQVTAYAEDDGQEISSLSLSGDGVWIVYVRGGDHGANWRRGDPVNPRSLQDVSQVQVGIWSVRAAGGAPIALAAADYPSITPDGRSVLFPKDDGIWSVPIDGSAPPRLMFSARGIGSLAWSPDGRQLAFVSSRDTHSFIGIYSLDTGSIRWLAPSTARDGSPRWSANGRSLAFIRQPSDLFIPNRGPARTWSAYTWYKRENDPKPWSIWVADVASGKAQRWWASGNQLKDAYQGDFLEWGGGGELVMLSYHDGWRHLYSVPGAGLKPVLLTPGTYSVEDMTLSADRRQVIFAANTGTAAEDIDRRHLFITALDKGSPRALTSGAGLEWQPLPMSEGRMAFISATAQRPPVVAWLKLGEPRIRLIEMDWMASYPVNQLVVPRKVTFEAPDGRIVHGQLFMPPVASSTPAKRYPAVVYVHGGPGPQQLLGWHRYRYFAEHYALNQYLAARGFVVLAVNYRTDESYGHDYNYPLDAGPHGASEYQDIRAAGRYLQARPEVADERIGIYGSSYGGYLTAMALARDSGLFRAGVDVHGVHDWIEMHDLRHLFARLPFDDPAKADPLLQLAWRSSPVSSVASWTSPVLFISGDDDRNVSFEQTLDLARRLEAVGVPYETVVLPGETHFMLLHADVLKMQEATAEFLERFLTKRAQ